MNIAGKTIFPAAGITAQASSERHCEDAQRARRGDTNWRDCQWTVHIGKSALSMRLRDW